MNENAFAWVFYIICYSKSIVNVFKSTTTCITCSGWLFFDLFHIWDIFCKNRWPYFQYTFHFGAIFQSIAVVSIEIHFYFGAALWNCGHKRELCLHYCTRTDRGKALEPKACWVVVVFFCPWSQLWSGSNAGPHPGLSLPSSALVAESF